MNPKQLGLMVRPGSGRVFIVAKKPANTLVVKDVTEDFVLMQAAEILREEAEGIETLYKVTHPTGEVIEIEVTARIVAQYQE